VWTKNEPLATGVDDAPAKTPRSKSESKRNFVALGVRNASGAEEE